MRLLGVLDDIQRNSLQFRLMRAYTSGTRETAEVLKTWSLIEEVESTPARPYVSHLLETSL